MKDNGFRNVMLQKSDEELIEIFQHKRDDYQEKAIWDIETILSERGFDLNSLKGEKDKIQGELTSLNNEIVENKDSLHSDDQELKNIVSSETANKGKSNVYGPLLVGIIMVWLAFADLGIRMYSDEAMIFNAFVNIFFRIIVLFWTIDLANKYSLNKTAWIILGLLFGGWQLIAINIAIWIIPETELKETHKEKI